MKGPIAILVGIVAAVAFIAGWILNPAAQTTMITSLVCGIAAMLGQLSTRELLGRSQSLVDRGIDDMYSDGGELLAQAAAMRLRFSRLALTALIAGILAPFFGTLRSVYPIPLWAACAFATAIVAVILAAALFTADRELRNLIDTFKIEAVKRKRARDANTERKVPIPTSQDTDPNLMGYGKGGASQVVSAR